ncbi:MAG: hypothetical protein E6K78_06650 [Candidatus Eisenbacteria bacterium]|uniref:RNA polymerase sigma-70 region 4 domain-containing protein n=1 Tax=Eiseniibacteriota bacterium TaxID=2212470 RepID=A0A538TRE9_UNCEI|nr:MAG: hypothetical protein E6K78_06650 [Candidatus Eisenbacteria bacterium]
MRPAARRSRPVGTNGRGSLSLVPETKRPERDRVALAPALRRHVLASFARRPARERLVLALLLYERLNTDEVASVIGISPAEVSRAYRTLLAKLRDVTPRREDELARSLRARARFAPERRRRAA